MKKPSQQERILTALQQHPEGVSMRYFERELMISQSTARVSELRTKGYDIQQVGEDEWGFSIQKLISSPKKRRVVYEDAIKDGVRYKIKREVWD